MSKKQRKSSKGHGVTASNWFRFTHYLHPRTLAFSQPTRQQWQQCCSCEACGPSPLLCPQGVVHLENNKSEECCGEESITSYNRECSRQQLRGICQVSHSKHFLKHMNVSRIGWLSCIKTTQPAGKWRYWSDISQLTCVRAAFQYTTLELSAMKAADIHMQTFKDILLGSYRFWHLGFSSWQPRAERINPSHRTTAAPCAARPESKTENFSVSLLSLSTQSPQHVSQVLSERGDLRASGLCSWLLKDVLPKHLQN